MKRKKITGKGHVLYSCDCNDLWFELNAFLPNHPDDIENGENAFRVWTQHPTFCPYCGQNLNPEKHEAINDL